MRLTVLTRTAARLGRSIARVTPHTDAVQAGISSSGRRSCKYLADEEGVMIEPLKLEHC